MEPADRTVTDALHREVDEELGGKVVDVVPAFVDTVAHSHHEDGTLLHPHGVKVQHFFACRLASICALCQAGNTSRGGRAVGAVAWVSMMDMRLILQPHRPDRVRVTPGPIPGLGATRVPVGRRPRRSRHAPVDRPGRLRPPQVRWPTGRSDRWTPPA